MLADDPGARTSFDQRLDDVESILVVDIQARDARPDDGKDPLAHECCPILNPANMAKDFETVGMIGLPEEGSWNLG